MPGTTCRDITRCGPLNQGKPGAEATVSRDKWAPRGQACAEGGQARLVLGEVGGGGLAGGGGAAQEAGEQFEFVVGVPVADLI